MAITSSIERLVRAASSRRRLAPLVEALGLGWADDQSSSLDPTSAEQAAGVRRLSVVGRCPGWLMLLAELGGAPVPEQVSRLAVVLRGRQPVLHQLILATAPDFERLVLAVFGLEGQLRQLALDRRRPRRADLEALEEMLPRHGETGVALAACYARALDRARITRQFFEDFKGFRALLASSWTNVPAELRTEREQLALLLLCRIMFLYFLQRDGHLAGDPAYLPDLLKGWQSGPGASFLVDRLQPLFFGALNTRPETRDPSAGWLRALPYLNGGLFERHPLEHRFPQHDLPDPVIRTVFENLFERYRFTSRELIGGGEAAVDPEMLGRVFEGLMAPEQRGRTGTFFTPPAMVDHLVKQALHSQLVTITGLTTTQAQALLERGDTTALDHDAQLRVGAWTSRIRVLDPACGSGAFLLGAMARLSALSAILPDVEPDSNAPATSSLIGHKRRIVGRSLYGVDLQEDAALLCALRLWLSLAVQDGSVGERTLDPLPNLDRRIRQGDALVDPLELAELDEPGRAPAPSVRPGGLLRAGRELERLAALYVHTGPDEKPTLQRRLRGAEELLARSWLDWMELRHSSQLQELLAQAAARDLFGERPTSALQAELQQQQLGERSAALKAIRTVLEEHGALPFFSFAIHFAEAAASGFDLILSNPPWVRSHRWPATLGRNVRARYDVCRRAGWTRGARMLGGGGGGGAGAQVDLSLLFLERSIRLLRPGGVLAMLMPAKMFRSLYGAGARRLLLRETELIRLEDHSLHPRSLFDADAFAGVVIARKRLRTDSGGGSSHVDQPCQAVMLRRSRRTLSFSVSPDELSVIPGDPESPWLLMPPAAREAIRRMQAAGPPLGERFRPRRGVTTGANPILVIREVEPKLAGLCVIRAEGYYDALRDGRPSSAARRYQAVIEQDSIRPLIRGADLSAWSYRIERHVLWSYERARTHSDAFPRAARYLARHEEVLRRRTGGRATRSSSSWATQPPSPMVAWRDLAINLEAVAIGCDKPGAAASRPVPLNTVYFVEADSDVAALSMAALLNSFPARVFTRSVAERAKDGRFRFFAWSVALLPLPPCWFGGPAEPRVLELASAAQEAGHLSETDTAELDRIACDLYGLSTREERALREFDAWLGRGIGR